MCDDHVLASDEDRVEGNGEGSGAGNGADNGGRTSLSRRGFLHGTAAAAAFAVTGAVTGGIFGETRRLPLHSPARPSAADGGNAYSMAMHIHSSFSELAGSMQAQIAQAARNSVDVLWWTDHDWRMDGYYYRDVVHFTSLTGEPGGPGQGGPWHWQAKQSGPLSSYQGGIVFSPVTPHDPDPHGSLSVAAQSAGTQVASYGFYADSQAADLNYRDNLTGQSLSIDVLLEPGWTAGYLEIAIGTSYHEASAGRPAGHYSLSYRIVPSRPQARIQSGNTGIITIPVRADRSTWTTVTINPSDDIAAFWPDLDYRDFSLYTLELNAVSTGDMATGYFGYLRFVRGNGGSACWRLQQQMMAGLAQQYPAVTQRQGLEVSWQEPHVNWFGPGIVVPGYQGVSPPGYLSYVQEVIGQAHLAGGLVSYNHPYGTRPRPRLSQSQQDALLASIAAQLLASRVYSCDLLEAAYNLRAGVDLAHHVALWDVMSRNGMFMTGIGVSDDHSGTNWYGETNNWITSAWAASTGQPDLMAALARGRCWSGTLSGFRGSLDLLVDGSVPMGSVSVSSVNMRDLVASATSMPANGYLQVLQGAVDYAGHNGLASNAQVIASYPANRLHSGSVAMHVSAGQDSYIRTQVLNASGVVVGLSNPVWLLRNPPPKGVPESRGA